MTRTTLVVVPVYGDLESLLRCVDGLLEHLDTTVHRVLLVNDCGPDADAIERALLHQAQGDTAAAVADLQRAVDAGFRDAAWLRATPLFAPLRAAPGWPRLLAGIDADVAAQRAQVLAAAWRPGELEGLSPARAAGTR